MTTHGEPGFSRFYLLLTIDALLAVLAGVTAFLLRFGLQPLLQLEDKDGIDIVVVAAVLLSSSYIFDVYNLGRHRDKRIIASNIIIATFVSFLVLSMIYFVVPSVGMGRGVLAIALIFFVLYQFSWHITFSSLFSRYLMSDKILIVGCGELAEKIGSLVQSPCFQFSHSFAGYVQNPNNLETKIVPERQVICSLSELTRQVGDHAVTHIVVAEQERRGNTPMRLELLNCKLSGVTIQDSPTFYEMLTGKLLLEHMDMDWLIFSTGFRRSDIFSAFKRQVDIFLALLGLILTLPLLPLIIILVKMNAAGPIFYTQLRVGQWGKTFSLYKFRTMPPATEALSGAVWAQKNDPRVRPIGGFLRKCRMDELPQLFNVLKGEMSFVGPRPERPEIVKELEELIPLYGKRHFIKPGLTGWAQVRYPYGASVADSYEKLRYDLYYFKNMTPIFDTIIFVKTLKVVLCGSGGR